MADLRAVQHALQEDIVYKESTLGIDNVCHKMNNNTRGIHYYGGIEKYDPTVSSIDSWAQASSHRINKYIYKFVNIQPIIELVLFTTDPKPNAASPSSCAAPPTR